MQKTKEVPISVKGIGSREKQNVTDAIENIVNDECDDVVSDDIKCQELKREQNVSQELTLCIFCGLPGAGKTYLANQCLQFLGTNLDLHVVSYDNHIEPESDLNIESWKKRRNRVYFKVKELVLNLKSMTTQHIKRKPHVIIVDDNMFLKSMRYSYFQLAREMSVGFSQLHVTTSLDTCLDRIRLRNFSDHSMVKVEDSTIIQMAGKFDVPDGSKNYWEKNSLSVTTDDINYTSLFDFLVSNSRNPVCANVEKTTKEVCGFDSFSHQADLLMRRLIKVRIDESRKNGLAVDGKKLSDVKKFLMKVFQSQSLETVFNDVLTLPTECQTLLALLEWPVQNWQPEDICEQVVSECFHCCSPPGTFIRNSKTNTVS